MNWYKLAQLYGDRKERLRGEWWFIDGSAHFADIDVSDMGHEGVAQSWAASMMSDHLAMMIKENADELKRNMLDPGKLLRYLDDEPDVQTVMENIRSYSEDINDKIESELISKYGEETFGVAIGDTKHDGRMWGLKRGWIRCKGNWLEMMSITGKSLREAAQGIGSAYGEEVDDNTEFNIEQTSNRRTFSGVPLYVIERGNPSLLLQYRDMV